MMAPETLSNSEAILGSRHASTRTADLEQHRCTASEDPDSPDK
jgi:hypothetical protein